MVKHADELINSLGRTETVKDVEAAYRQIMEGRRKFEIIARQAKSDHERTLAELEVFIDDLRQITGLPLEHPRFKQLLLMTLGKRFARMAARRQQAEDGDGLRDFPI